MSKGLHCLLIVSAVLGMNASVSVAANPNHPPQIDRPPKIVLIAGKKSHGPVGNGIHDYPWSVKLLKVMLDNSNVAERVQVEYHLDDWPEDPQTLDDADTILIVSDGRDGDKYEEAPHFSSSERRDLIAKQVARGCGFATFHFSTFAPDDRADDILDWSGGYFDWETDGKRNWYSAIKTLDAPVNPAIEQHPVLNGVRPFQMKEEFYFNLRFREGDAALQPLLVVPDLKGREPGGNVVAWGRERTDGGRGFGTTCGHFYENWKNDDFRRLMLNALLWTAHVEIPEHGVESRFYTHGEITSALAGIEGTERAVMDTHPIRALILGGNHHPGHHWKETSPVIKESLERDPRMSVELSDEIEDLATSRIHDFDLLVLNYCNWDRPGLSEAAKEGFLRYLRNGGGLVIVHFANGAFHHSLPKSGDSDWPEYRKICRRVWDHSNRGTGHDRYGKFTVEIVSNDHPITSGMEPFQTTDELYFDQVGTDPITVLATARSGVTGKQEPMAFTYEYDKARVFQTVLGHSVESLKTEGTAELLRRSAAWVAGKEQLRPGQLKSLTTSSTSSGNERLTEGKFQKGLNASRGGAWIAGQPEFGELPLTVECWIKLDHQEHFNILVAHEEKTSGTHWELFTPPRSGVLIAYLPGQTPDHISSSKNICDNQWHFITMIYEPHRVRLFVDAVQVADQKIEAKRLPRHPGDLAIGTLISRSLGCQGVIDEVRLSRGVRTIELPREPLETDESTLGLWRFNERSAGDAFRDESRHQRHAHPSLISVLSKKSPEKSQSKDHWGVDAVGFQWTEQDSVDNRWNQSDVGPFLASTLFLPDLPPVEKGLSIKVGNREQGTICFDTGRLEWRAAWTGGFLNFHPARFGVINAPRITGELKLASHRTSGWGTSDHQFQKVSLRGNRVVLQYRIGTVEIQESPGMETDAGQSVFIRELEPGEVTKPITIPLHAASAPFALQSHLGFRVATSVSGEQSTAFAVSETSAAFEVRNQTELVLPIVTHPSGRPFKIFSWTGPSADLDTFLKIARHHLKQDSFVTQQESGETRWKEQIQTTGTLGTGRGPYLLDTITLPFENPYRALMFVSGHDLFSNGDIAVSTLHGDVWIVSGVNDKLDKLTWKRFATGLFQPLGLKIIRDQIYVLGRDQITRLVDINGDGEADDYECVNNTYHTSSGGHDYVACLETDSKGNFYFVHATQGVVRAPADGRLCETIATGLRNPNGMSVGPDDRITVAPQEGNWTPASAIFAVQQGDYFGYGGPKISAQRPLGYTPPICWIPRLVDNSSGGQVWVTSDRWGPLSGHLLHFTFGKCRMMLVLQEAVQGSFQGGTVDFPLDFDSGVMRGRFSPLDGQLYVSGLRGWVSAAVQDGCLQRVRYNGEPVDLPVAVKTMKNGLAITFSQLLDHQHANDPDHYHLQQWNYRYAATYGSPGFRVSNPLEEGRDSVDVRSATLLEDGRTVFLEIPDLQPVMQLSIHYQLKSQRGSPVQQTISYTIHQLGLEEIASERLNHSSRAGELSPEDQARLRPGLIATFQQDGVKDFHKVRMAALAVPEGIAPTSLLKPEVFHVVNEGFLKVPLKGTYEFWLEGTGQAELLINGHKVLSTQGEFTSERRASVLLSRGENPLELRYRSPPQGGARYRLIWRGENFQDEAVPSSMLWSFGDHSELDRFNQVRQGQNLFEKHRCAHCHSGDLSSNQVASRDNTPQLHNIGDRLTTDWMANWILNPHQFRHQATMPRLLNAENPGDRQLAADIALWLGSLQAGDGSPVTDGTSGNVELGERLFIEQSCYVCHHFGAASEPEEHQRLSLSGVASKFQPGSLAAFLRVPHAHFRLTGMPDFRLSPEESEELAAYLESRSQRTEISLLELQSADLKRGEHQFFAIGCGNCHSAGNPFSFRQTPQVPRLSSTSSGGCLTDAGRDAVRVPDYRFNADEKVQLLAALRSNAFSFAETVSPFESAERLITALRCNSCHSRDQDVSPRAAIYIDEFDDGLLPDSLPALTWTGEKLQTDWMSRFLKGDISAKPRTWLKAKMPAFPGYADQLATGLAAQHGVNSLPATHNFVPELAQIGKELSQKNTGLDCRQCHAVGQEQPVGDQHTQIAQGINFLLIRDRLRPDFYRRFVIDPPRYDVNTKMPKLAVDGVSTKIQTHFDGNADNQFHALWNYIQSLDDTSNN